MRESVPQKEHAFLRAICPLLPFSKDQDMVTKNSLVSAIERFRDSSLQMYKEHQKEAVALKLLTIILYLRSKRSRLDCIPDLVREAVRTETNQRRREKVAAASMDRFEGVRQKMAALNKEVEGYPDFEE